MHFQLIKNSLPRTNFRADSVTEWFRQWTDNLMDALRVGSIPGTGDFFLFLFFLYDDDGGVTHSGAGERKAQASTCRNECSECRR